MDNNIFDTKLSKHRLTEKEKRSDDNRWYKDYCDAVDKGSFYNDNFFSSLEGNTTGYESKKVNYDLFNNILNKNDLKYVYRPYGDNVGELPANMTNRDIVSSKIKVLLGMEMSIPFSWNVVATNGQASTRKEEKEMGMIRDYVINEIMMPIRQQAEKDAAEQSKGRKLSPEEQKQLQEQIQQEVQQKTPDEVRKYMVREHKDPSEVQGQQILEYLIYQERIADKFNKGFKHMMLGGKEVFRVDIVNNEPALTVTNALFFDHDQSPEIEFIEDGTWAIAEYGMTPNQILSEFGTVLTDKQIDKIFDFDKNRTTVSNTDFSFSSNGFKDDMTIRVRHSTWKAPMKIGFLSYLDENGQIQEKIVDENYKYNRKAGDIELEWVWLPNSYECWKILDDIYVYPRQVPGQNKDIDNLFKTKLPYYGASIDNLNSPITAPMERIKGFQYYYDVVLYRTELMLASDKGKMLLMNINAVPKSAGIDTDKWLYFMEANHIAFINPKEEGNRAAGGSTGPQEVSNLATVLDMSLASQIDNYIKLAEYIEIQCGAAIGVTKAMEGAIGPTDAVTNTKQNLIQSSYITRPYFELHNQVKRNVLQALIETAKVAYGQFPSRKLNYFLDDMSIQMLTTDPGLLDDSTLAVFVTNSSKAEETKRAIINLSQAALQNQQATLLDIANIIDSSSVTEAKELLEVSIQKSQERQDSMEKQKMQIQKDEIAREDQKIRDQWKHEADMITLKAQEDRKTKVGVELIAAAGYDVNKDEDADGVPDILEYAKFGVDADVKRQNANTNAAKLILEQDKFQHQQSVDKQTLKQKDKELVIKATKKPSK